MGLRHSKKCELKSDLQSLISSEKLIIFTVSHSKPCYECIQILKAYLLTPFLINIDHEPSPSSTMQGLFQLTGTLIYPQVFISGKFFGSLKELKTSIKKNQFVSILTSNQIPFKQLSYEERQILSLNPN